MKFIKKLTLTLLFAMCLITPVTLARAAEYAGAASVNADGVRLRAENGTDSKILAVLAAGTAINVSDKTGDWYRVTAGTLTGYIRADFVIIPEAASAPESAGPIFIDEETPLSSGAPGHIAADGVNFRDSGDINANVLASLQKGMPVTVLDSSGEWYRVKYNDTNGYVLGRYVSLAGIGAAGADTV